MPPKEAPPERQPPPPPIKKVQTQLKAPSRHPPHQLKEVQTQLKAARTENAAVTQQLKAVGAENAAVTQQLSEEHKKVTKLEKKLARLTKSTNKLRKEGRFEAAEPPAGMMANIQRLAAHITDLEKELEKSKTPENTLTKTRRTNYEAMIIAVEEQLTQMAAEKSELEEQLTQMAAEISELEELNDTLNDDRHTLTDKNDELKREFEGKTDALREKTRELKAAEAQCDDYKGRLEQDDREAHQQRDKMTAKYKELKKGMQTKLDTMHQELGEHWQGVHLKKLATTKRVIMAEVLEAVVEDVLTEFRRRKTDDDTVENIMNVVDSGLRKAMLAAYEKALPQEPPPVVSSASRKTKKKKRTRRRRGRR